MASPAGSTHKGRNIAIGVIIGAVVVILLIVLIRAIVEKRRDDAREAARAGIVARTTRTGAGGSSTAGASAGAGGSQQGSASASSDGQPAGGSVPGQDAPASGDQPGADSGQNPADGGGGDGSDQDGGPISFTPLHIVSQSVTPNPVPLNGILYCSARIQGNATSVTMQIDGPINEDSLFTLSSGSMAGDVTEWTYSHNSPHSQGAYRYQVTATAADGTSVTSDWADFIVAAQ